MKNKLLNWTIIIIGLILIVNISRSILDLSGRNKVVEEAELRVRKAEEENATLREKYYEVTRDEYLEEVAREKLGLGKEGEMVVVLPKSIKEDDSAVGQAEGEEKQVEPQPVWRQWAKLFF